MKHGASRSDRSIRARSRDPSVGPPERRIRVAVPVCDTTRPSRSAIDDVGDGGQLRIVRHEHERRAARPVHLEQQVDDVAARRAVEVAGRLVGQQDRRVVRERPRDRHALLLAARELRRVVMAAVRQARPRRAAPRARAPRAGHARDLHRHQHVLERRQRRDQVKELEDEADLLAAQPRERVLAERRDVDAVDRRCVPLVGASRPAISPSSVDLPLPDGPVIATTLPSGTEQIERVQDRERAGCRSAPSSRRRAARS